MLGADQTTLLDGELVEKTNATSENSNKGNIIAGVRSLKTDIPSEIQFVNV